MSAPTTGETLDIIFDNLEGAIRRLTVPHDPAERTDKASGWSESAKAEMKRVILGARRHVEEEIERTAGDAADEADELNNLRRTVEHAAECLRDYDSFGWADKVPQARDLLGGRV